jgi:BirA family biotin operon repressor/biotin-[acetyl-CoA-carboxylase] ligase
MQIGQKIIHLDTIDSTNNYAANLQKAGKIVHGTVIMADEQTAGRGQLGAKWHSKPAENLLCSVFIVPDNLSVHQQFLLTQYASLSVLNVLRKIGINAQIKWPNDVYVNTKKIAGILIENTIKGTHISTTILGIGLNVNQLAFEELNATSSMNETNTFYAINELVFLLINELNELWNVLDKKDSTFLNEQYLQHLYLRNEKALFEDTSGIFEGKIVDVSPEGLLIVEKDNEKVAYSLKEIHFISQNAL